MSKADLRLDWCSYEAAKYAVEHWHYSQVMPAGKLVKVGAWESGRFIGCVLFGRGANNHIGSPYGLEQTQVCELARIALREHKTPVSRITSIAIRFLRSNSPGLRLIVSYADPLQSHHGGIYQAMGWLYEGKSRAQHFTLGADGKMVHKRSANSRYGTITGLLKSDILWKHKYLYPLDDAMRAQIAPLAQPYPKRDKRGPGEIDNAPGSNRETGGASPTGPLSEVALVD